jgi:hypothetical protein
MFHPQRHVCALRRMKCNLYLDIEAEILQPQSVLRGRVHFLVILLEIFEKPDTIALGRAPVIQNIRAHSGYKVLFFLRPKFMENQGAVSPGQQNTAIYSRHGHCRSTGQDQRENNQRFHRFAKKSRGDGQTLETRTQNPVTFPRQSRCFQWRRNRPRSGSMLRRIMQHLWCSSVPQDASKLESS